MIKRSFRLFRKGKEDGSIVLTSRAVHHRLLYLEKEAGDLLSRQKEETAGAANEAGSPGTSGDRGL